MAQQQGKSTAVKILAEARNAGQRFELGREHEIVPDETQIQRLLAHAVAHQRQLTLLPVPQSRSEEHTSELQSLMRSSYAVFCLKKKKKTTEKKNTIRRKQQ